MPASLPRFGAAFAALALFASPALAEPVTVPPGDGMIEAPCPAQQGLWFGHSYVKQYDWAWLCRFQADNVLAAKASPPAAVFIGDSITEGWLRSDPDFFAHGNVDRGISGQTSPQMLLRFYQDVIALHPRVVHIMAGTNDIAGNTGPTSPEAFKNNIRAMIDLARANAIGVVLASIPPADHFTWKPAMAPAARIAELNAWLRELARERGLVFADYHAALTADGGAMRPEFSRDGVHPVTQGYAVMRPVAEAALRQAERGLTSSAVTR